MGNNNRRESRLGLRRRIMNFVKKNKNKDNELKQKKAQLQQFRVARLIYNQNVDKVGQLGSSLQHKPDLDMVRFRQAPIFFSKSKKSFFYITESMIISEPLEPPNSAVDGSQGLPIGFKTWNLPSLNLSPLAFDQFYLSKDSGSFIFRNTSGHKLVLLDLAKNESRSLTHLQNVAFKLFGLHSFGDRVYYVEKSQTHHNRLKIFSYTLKTNKRRLVLTFLAKIFKSLLIDEEQGILLIMKFDNQCFMVPEFYSLRSRKRLLRLPGQTVAYSLKEQFFQLKFNRLKKFTEKENLTGLNSIRRLGLRRGRFVFGSNRNFCVAKLRKREFIHFKDNYGNLSLVAAVPNNMGINHMHVSQLDDLAIYYSKVDDYILYSMECSLKMNNLYKFGQGFSFQAYRASKRAQASAALFFIKFKQVSKYDSYKLEVYKQDEKAAFLSKEFFYESRRSSESIIKQTRDQALIVTKFKSHQFDNNLLLSFKLLDKTSLEVTRMRTCSLKLKRFLQNNYRLLRVKATDDLRHLVLDIDEIGPVLVDSVEGSLDVLNLGGKRNRTRTSNRFTTAHSTQATESLHYVNKDQIEPKNETAMEKSDGQKEAASTSHETEKFLIINFCSLAKKGQIVHICFDLQKREILWKSEIKPEAFFFGMKFLTNPVFSSHNEFYSIVKNQGRISLCRFLIAKASEGSEWRLMMPPTATGKESDVRLMGLSLKEIYCFEGAAGSLSGFYLELLNDFETQSQSIAVCYIDGAGGCNLLVGDLQSENFNIKRLGVHPEIKTVIKIYKKGLKETNEVLNQQRELKLVVCFSLAHRSQIRLLEVDFWGEEPQSAPRIIQLGRSFVAGIEKIGISENWFLSCNSDSVNCLCNHFTNKFLQLGQYAPKKVSEREELIAAIREVLCLDIHQLVKFVKALELYQVVKLLNHAELYMIFCKKVGPFLNFEERLEAGKQASIFKETLEGDGANHTLPAL